MAEIGEARLVAGAPGRAVHGSAAAAPGVSELRDFWQLLKPNVMQLVLFTSAAALYLAPGHLHPLLAFTAMLCIALGAAASAAINNWFDADIDRRMARTRLRPTASGRIEPAEALARRHHARDHLRDADGARAELAGRCPAGAHHRLLRPRLHHLAEAAHAAEHRHRRCCRRVAADGRLGGGDRRRLAAAGPAVPHHLPVDAAAFLGAGALPDRRLRPGRRADAAGRGRAPSTLRPHPGLYPAARRRDAGAGGLGRPACSTGGGAGLGGVFIAYAVRLWREIAICWPCAPSATRSSICSPCLPRLRSIARCRICCWAEDGDERGRAPASPTNEECRFGRGLGRSVVLFYLLTLVKMGGVPLSRRAPQPPHRDRRRSGDPGDARAYRGLRAALRPLLPGLRLRRHAEDRWRRGRRCSRKPSA